MIKGGPAGLPQLAELRPHSAQKAFVQGAQSIISGWDSKRRATPEADGESANAWFKREAYRLLRYSIDLGQTSVFESVIKYSKRPSRLVAEALKNPFKLGLLAMFTDESLPRRNRHVFGNQMLYAWRHDVPPEFLNAFLAVSGGPEVIARKLKDHFVEAGFEGRHIASRVSD